MVADKSIEGVLRIGIGLPAEANIDEKIAFTKYCLKNYQKQGWIGSSLSKLFSDDFASFTIEELRHVDSHTRWNLRNLLREPGVFAPQGRSKPIANSLFLVVQEEIPWLEDGLKKPAVKEQIFANSTIQQKGHPSMSRKAGESLKEQPAEAIAIGEGNMVFENTVPELVPHWKQGIMVNLFKAHSDDSDKYGGSSSDNFGRELMLFLERYE